MVWYNICMFRRPTLACGGPVDCDLTFDGTMLCHHVILIYSTFPKLRAFLTIVHASFLSVEDPILDDALILQ